MSCQLCHQYIWESILRRKEKKTRKIVLNLKRKVKCTLVQALRLCTGRTAHRGSRGIALLFHDHGIRRGWGVSVTPRSLFTPRERPGTHFIGGWVGPRAGLDRRGKFRLPPGFDPRTVQPVDSLINSVHRYTASRVSWNSVPVHSDKDPVKAICNNNYVKYDSGIKEKSYQNTHCSHTPIVKRTSNSHSKGMNNERQ